MSREHVEYLRAVFERYDSDPDPRAFVYHLFGPDGEWHALPDDPDSDVYRGPEAITAYLSDWPRQFDDFRVDGDEMIDCGDCVVVPVVLRGRVRGSTQEVSLQQTQTFCFRDGRVTEVREYRTTEEALEAVGASRT